MLAPMERVAWTDERLDDMSRRMDAGFDRLDRDFRELRIELKEEIKELRVHINRIGGGLMVGVIATVFLHGS
jgi:hypothetical protein